MRSSISWLILAVVLGLLLHSDALVAHAEAAENHQLNCVAIANVPGRSADLHYKLRLCPADGAACVAEWTKGVLGQKGGGLLDVRRHCHLADKPSIFVLQYDWSPRDQYDPEIADLAPMVVDWRGMVPSEGCYTAGRYRFAPRGEGIQIGDGFPSGSRAGSCVWTADYREFTNAPTPDLTLPGTLHGGWVPQGQSCPASADRQSNDGGSVWIQPHAIEFAGGPCWLSGRFMTGERFDVPTLCAEGNGYRMHTLSFDRMSQTGMRLRIDGGKRQAYQRCSVEWQPDPEQASARVALSGVTATTTFQLSAEYRMADEEVVRDTHRRAITLSVDADGAISDRLQIGDSAERTFETRLGRVVLDSSGARATWLRHGGKLIRMRERRGYFELSSWPLSNGGNAISCEGFNVALMPKRADGRLVSVLVDGREIDVLKHEVGDVSCSIEGRLAQASSQSEFQEFDIKPPESGIDNAFNRPPADASDQPAELTAETEAALSECERGDGDSRTAACTRAIESGELEGDNLAIALGNRAIAYLEANRNDEAIADASRFIEIEPDHGIAYFVRGEALRMKARHAEALLDLDKAIALNPLIPDVFFTRGQIHMAAKRYAPAIADFTAAIERNPDLAAAYQNRAVSNQRLGRVLEALADMNAAVERRPNNVDALLARAGMHLDYGLLNKAEDDILNAREIAPDHPDLWLYSDTLVDEFNLRAKDDRSVCVRRRLRQVQVGSSSRNIFLTNRCTDYSVTVLLREKGKTAGLVGDIKAASVISLSAEGSPWVEEEAFLSATEALAIDQKDFEARCGSLPSKDARARSTCFLEVHAATQKKAQ